MSFPSSPSELTREWLSEALGTQIDDFRVEHFGEGAGIIGMVTRLHLTGPDAPATIIAKFPSPAEENRAVAATYDMYNREVQFYRQIANQINLRVPACYAAEFDPERSDFVLLMEDLQGLRIGDQVAGCDAADARLVIEGIARFHASTWRSKQLIVSHNNPGQRDGMIAGFQLGWPVVLEQFPEYVPDEVKPLAEQLPEHVGELLDRMTADPISIIHADVRLDNVFFGDGEIALVDWQAVCTSAPEQDLAYFVTQSLSDEVRNSADWVALYHQTLVDAGIDDYSLEACRERYRVSALYLLCYAVVIAGTLDLGNERGMQLGRTLFGNSMRSLIELDAFSLLSD